MEQHYAHGYFSVRCRSLVEGSNLIYGSVKSRDFMGWPCFGHKNRGFCIVCLKNDGFPWRKNIIVICNENLGLSMRVAIPKWEESCFGRILLRYLISFSYPKTMIDPFRFRLGPFAHYSVHKTVCEHKIKFSNRRTFSNRPSCACSSISNKSSTSWATIIDEEDRKKSVVLFRKNDEIFVLFLRPSVDLIP